MEVIIGNGIAILLVVLLVVVCGRNVIQMIRSELSGGGCAGCAGGCSGSCSGCSSCASNAKMSKKRN